jgi:hypothetical protein
MPRRLNGLLTLGYLTGFSGGQVEKDLRVEGHRGPKAENFPEYFEKSGTPAAPRGWKPPDFQSAASPNDHFLAPSDFVQAGNRNAINGLGQSTPL